MAQCDLFSTTWVTVVLDYDCSNYDNKINNNINNVKSGSGALSPLSFSRNPGKKMPIEQK